MIKGLLLMRCEFMALRANSKEQVLIRFSLWILAYAYSLYFYSKASPQQLMKPETECSFNPMPTKSYINTASLIFQSAQSILSILQSQFYFKSLIYFLSSSSLDQFLPIKTNGVLFLAKCSAYCLPMPSVQPLMIIYLSEGGTQLDLIQGRIALNSLKETARVAMAVISIMMAMNILITIAKCDIYKIAKIIIKISNPSQTMHNNKYALVIHGGAGTIAKSLMTPELEAQYQDCLMEALKAGQTILKSNGTSLDAVQAAIKIMEDSQCFNAGKGSVFSAKGINQMDASIMEGKTRKAGAIAGSTKIKNPVSAARKVMEKSKHVMLSGSGADEFAAEQGLQLAGPQYFFSKLRFNQLLSAKQEQACILDHSDISKLKKSFDAQFIPMGSPKKEEQKTEKKFGTVGAVAIDAHGNLAAATSTGGMTNKKWGRIGDSPIIGAGCYANNKTCAVSSTGEGEYFIREVLAYEISAMMQFGHMSLQEAANKVIYEKLPQIGGTGGVIAVDKDYNVVMPFNTSGMYRGFVTNSQQKKVFIYKQ